MVTELYGQGYKEYGTGMASGFDMRRLLERMDRVIFEKTGPCAGMWFELGGKALECVPPVINTSTKG